VEQQASLSGPVALEIFCNVRMQVHRGSLLDLITYPTGRKLLVIGVSEVVIDAEEVKRQIKERVIPALSQKFTFNEEIGVFTERELKGDPMILAKFLGLSPT
jgi:hypothetical protein